VAAASSSHHRRSRQGPLTGVRRRLVAWNIGVLCAILLLVAAGVYISQSRAVAAAVDAQLVGQARRGLLSGHPVEDLAEARVASTSSAAPASDSAEERTEPYEASESPNVFSLLIDPQGHVVHTPQEVQAQGLPDMAAIWPVLRRAAPSTLVTLDTHASKGADHFRLYTVPVRQDEHIVGALQVGTSLAPRYAELRNFLALLAIMGGAGVLLAAAGGLFLAGRALVPVQAAFERQRAFVADASHELRTPLSLMRAGAELLTHALERGTQTAGAGVAARADGSAATRASAWTPSASDARPEDAAEWAEMARDVVSEVDYMSHLIDHLLQLARMDSGTEQMRHELVALDALAERVCRSAEPLAAGRSLRLTFQVGRPSAEVGVSDEARDGSHLDGFAGQEDPASAGAAALTSDLWVWGDPDRLRQVLLILLDNALRYTPAPSVVRVACWRAPGTATRPATIVAEVADTGTGIAPEHLTRLFDRFYRVDKARSRELGGSGLGLAIAAGIARAHGGTIAVQSEVGAGSTFRLELPAAPARASD
jgi:two-component system, OmpR family, sensor histidine kinase CiaH